MGLDIMVDVSGTDCFSHSLSSCVFQEKFKVSQKQVNVFTRFPVGTIQTQATSTLQLQKESAKAAAAAAASLSCSQCSRNITFQPELIQIKVRCED